MPTAFVRRSSCRLSLMSLCKFVHGRRRAVGLYKTRILSASHACHNYTHAHRSQTLMHCNWVQPGRDVLKTLSHKTQAETFQTETTSLQLGSRGSVLCPPSSPLPAFRATVYICQVEKSHLMFKFMYVGLTFRGESGDAVSASKFGAAYSAPRGPLAGGDGAGWNLMPAVLTFQASPVPPPNFQTPELKSWLRPCGFSLWRIEWCDRHLCHVTGSEHA